MAKIIEATAVISARDQTGGAFQALAQKLESVARAGDRVKGAMGNMSAETGRRLQELNQKIALIDNFRGMSRGLDEANLRMRRAQDELRRTQAALQAVTAPTRELQSAYDRASRAANAATAAFRQQGAAVREARSALEASGIPVNRIAAEQARLKSAIDQTTAAIQRQSTQARMLASGNGPWGSSRRSGSGVPLIGSSALPMAPVVAGAATSGASGVGGALGHAVEGVAAGHIVRRTYERARDGWVEMDEATRRQRAILSIEPGAQSPMMQQALRIGQDTRFTNADVVRSQTTIGSRLPRELQTSGVIMGVTNAARDYALAMNTTMDQGAEAIISRMLARRYDMSTPEAAQASARHAANRLVQLAKTSGMSHDDIVGYTKFGAAPGEVAGIPEDLSDALAAQLRRIGYEGSMAGNFVRAASMKLSTPTRNALDALAAMGINHSNYVRGGEEFSATGLSRMARTTFGRELNSAQVARLNQIFDDEEITGDRGRFQTEVGRVLQQGLARRTRSGAVNAQDAERISKMVDRFYTLSAEGVDTERLLMDVFRRGISPAVARYLFGQEHGGRAQGIRFDQLERDRDSMRNTPGNRAESIGQEIQAGAAGAYQRMIGSIETFYMRLGQVNDGLLSFAWDKIGNGIDAIANLPDKVLQLGTAAVAATAALLGIRAAASVGALVSGVAGAAGAAGLAGGAAGATGAGAAAAGGGMLSRLAGFGALRAAGTAGAAYMAYEGASAFASGVTALAEAATGKYFTPDHPLDVANLRDMLAQKERELAGIRERTHPSMRDEYNHTTTRLESEITMLRTRLAGADFYDRYRAPAGLEIGRGDLFVDAPSASGRMSGVDALGGGMGGLSVSPLFGRGLEPVPPGERPGAGEVTARLEGQAQVAVQVTVQESPNLIARVTQSVMSQAGHVTVTPTGVGSTGVSMPEAAAPTGSPFVGMP